MKERAIKFGVPKQKVLVIPNAVNPDIFKPEITSDFRSEQNIPSDAKIILTIRRLVFEKRVEDVIEAFARIDNEHTYLVIGGDGPDREKLEKLVKERNIESRVRFLGFVDNKDLPPIYAGSDIYVLSSQQEGLSLSLLESMATGLITISTAGTGGSEVIDDGMNGYLYKVGDVEKLTSILLQAVLCKTRSR